MWGLVKQYSNRSINDTLLEAKGKQVYFSNVRPRAAEGVWELTGKPEITVRPWLPVC